MTKLTGLTSGPIQSFQTQIDTGETVKFKLRYMPSVQMWFIDIEYSDVTINQMRLCSHPNLLRQYRNNIPFGLWVRTTGIAAEPFLINDIQSGRVSLYILTETEVSDVEDAISA